MQKSKSAKQSGAFIYSCFFAIPELFFAVLFLFFLNSCCRRLCHCLNDNEWHYKPKNKCFFWVVLSTFGWVSLEKKAKNSQALRLFRIMSRAALCSAELCSTRFQFSKNSIKKQYFHFSTLRCIAQNWNYAK